MPNYRIHRMKESARQHFRLAPHVSGAANVKRRDYDEDGPIDGTGQIAASNEYAAWDQLRASERPFEVGDLLETEGGELRICKYIGFEAAAWQLPPAEPVSAPDSTLTPPAASAIGYTASDQRAGE